MKEFSFVLACLLVVGCSGLKQSEWWDNHGNGYRLTEVQQVSGCGGKTIIVAHLETNWKGDGEDWQSNKVLFKDEPSVCEKVVGAVLMPAAIFASSVYIGDRLKDTRSTVQLNNTNNGGNAGSIAGAGASSYSIIK